MHDDFRPAWAAKPAPKLKPTPQPNNQPEPAVPFQTPEEVSHVDLAMPVELPEPATGTKPRGTGHHWFNLPWPPNRQEIILTSLVLGMSFFGVIGFLSLHKTPVAPVAAVKPVQKTAVQKPATAPSTLSGLPVAPEVNQRPVVGVMIENSQVARPQSGLSEAGVVFEAVAEGGITRFLALFQDQQPSNIGPVRSARPYYVQWSEGFRAAYTHVGGSPDALANIKAWGVQDLDQFANPGPFRRSSARPAPHNMYSSVVDLAALATQKGYKSDFTGFPRKQASPAKQPAAKSIDMSISSAIYNSHYEYDAASNTYLRSEGGAVQKDANTDKQLAPSVVIALVVPLSAGAKTAQGGSYSNYNPIGTGQALIFQDGGVIVGNWTKTDNAAQITFTDENGAAVKLNPGQTWLTAVTGADKVAYK